MSMTSEEALRYEDACVELLKQSGVRFAGLINKQGQLITGGFKKGVQPYEVEEEKRRMMFMEMVLDLSMRKQFDQSLGSIKSITSKREKVNMTTIPLGNHLLLISSEPKENLENIISEAYKIFRNIRLEALVLAN